MRRSTYGVCVGVLGAFPVLNVKLEVSQGRQPTLDHEVRVRHGLEVGQGGVISSHNKLLVAQELGPLRAKVQQCEQLPLLRRVPGPTLRQASSSVGHYALRAILNLAKHCSDSLIKG